ncbi:hypothetical protein HNV11_02580 [Spirosoma taeanense]|uniref:Uncharacterized protein n=1 Tax=Spirosoma taeanense TaxID=2735870 RepID=A0A6M5Y0M8_9BACT|nr:hypothetical protein [Spirosoma taeanense]QJW88337.1 hypothetical protein HNV11_02580 [Spirosoma taeanense]
MIEKLLLQAEKYPLDFITQLSGGFPILISIVNYRLLPTTSKFIGLFFALYFIQDTTALWLSLLKQNNLFIQNSEAIIQTILVGCIYYYSFESHLVKRLILFYTLICSAIGLIFFKSYEISAIDLIIFRVFAICLVLSYFNKILQDMRIKNVAIHTLFWFSAGLLIYAAGTFFIVLFSEYWYKDINKVPAAEFDRYWNASQVLFILFSLLATVGLSFSKYEYKNLI